MGRQKRQLTSFFFTNHNSERVHGDSWYSKYFSWRNTAFIVKRLEVLDQNNGFGSESTLMDGGVDHRFVTLDCYTWSLEPLDYDFIIYIYGEPFSTNDVIQGEITDTSSLVHRYQNKNAKFPKYTDFYFIVILNLFLTVYVFLKSMAISRFSSGVARH